MNKRKLIIVSISLVSLIVILLAAYFLNQKFHFFADMLDANSFGNDRVRFIVIDNNLKLTVNQLETNTPLDYPSAPFYYTRIERVNDVDVEVNGIFNFASLASSAQSKVLTLSDTTKNVSFDINVVTKSNYLTFEIVKVNKPSDVEIKKFEGSILSAQLLCPAGNPNCVGLVSYCLSSSCEYSNFVYGNQVMYFRGVKAPGFPLEGGKFLLVTADHDSRSIELARTIESVKQDLGVSRVKSYDPTFFALGSYIYSKANAELVAKKLSSFGYKRILIFDLGWQKSRGSWDLNTASFPDGLKSAVDIFHQNGIQVGLHTLAATVSSNNALYLSGDIAKDSAGKAISPSGMTGLYLVNYLNPASLSAYTDNLTSKMAENGIDFAYLDGSEWFGLGASGGAYRAINNEAINQFASKTKIDFQTSAYSGIHTDKDAITDVWQTQGDTTHPNDIKYWLDNTVTINSSQYDSARTLMSLKRARYFIPNFGWTPLTLSEDPSHYSYALSAAIASGAPLTTETNLNNFMTDPWADIFQPIFKERLGIWNQIAANSVQTNSFSGSAGERVIQFDNDAMGVTLPKSPAENYEMNAGNNRRIFIDPWAGTKTNLKITFSDLVPNTRYALETGKKYLFDPAQTVPNEIYFTTTAETTYSTTVPLDSKVNDYLFLTLEQQPLIGSINIAEGQVITANPYIISVVAKDTAETLKISKVEFFVDNTLISTSTLPDVSGTYQAVWDTSKYHSVVKVIVYGIDGTTQEITRNTTVNLSETQEDNDIVVVLPKTGEISLKNRIMYLIDKIKKVIFQ